MVTTTRHAEPEPVPPAFTFAVTTREVVETARAQLGAASAEALTIAEAPDEHGVATARAAARLRGQLEDAVTALSRVTTVDLTHEALS